MSKCIACGKKGLFLSVNADGLCKSCAEIERQKQQAEAEAKRIEAKKAKIMPPYLDWGNERRYKTRIYNCDIYDYTGKDIEEFDKVTFIRDMKAYEEGIYNHTTKVMHNGKLIGYVDRQGIADMICEEVVTAYIIDPESIIPSFDIAVYSKITSLPAISVIRLQTDQECIDNYSKLKNEITKFTSVDIAGNRVLYHHNLLGTISEKEIVKFTEIPDDREQYPVFYSERADKKGNVILSIKVYYSIAKDELFRDTSRYRQQ